MTDLLNQARQSRANGNKKMWTGEETVALVILKGQGLTAKQIAKIVKHSENSVTYRFNRWCSKFDSFAAHFGWQNKTMDELTEMVDKLKAE